MLDMRPATMADGDMLFEWANDPDTRTWSARSIRGGTYIPREVHDNWMRLNVLMGYPKHVVMIADTEFGAAGVVRFDMIGNDVMRHRVSITVAPQFRGRGLAHGILAEACRLMAESTLIAEIKHGNDRSVSIFERCGFEKVKDSVSYRHYQREPLA